jgi:hypothetical protein
MKGRSIKYSDHELAWIEKRKADPRKLMHAAFCKRFGRNDVSLTNLNSLCKRNGWMTGRLGTFQKGDVPVNKGKKMPYNPNSARTQFKKGNEPHNTQFLGHERLSKEGYVEISVAETNPHTGYGRRYVQKHRHLWEAKHGPIPEGKVLKCLDGDKTNTEPSNWKLIDRGVLARLNSRWGLKYDDAEPEVKPSVLAVAELRQRTKEAAEAMGDEKQ